MVLPLLLRFNFLESADGAPFALAGTRIRAGTLSPAGKPAAVAQADVASDVHETLDIHGRFGAQRSFNFILVIDDVTDAGFFLGRQVFDFFHLIHSGFLQDALGGCLADPVNIRQSDKYPFIFR